MKLLALAVIFGLFAFSQANSTTPQSTTTKSTTIKPTTIKPTTIKPTTIKPTTIKPTTTKSTTAQPTTAKSTTAQPTTTSSKATTTTPKTTVKSSTTTSKTSSTTVLPSSTTAKPTGPPRYQIQNEKNETCLVMQGNIKTTFTANKTKVVSVVPWDAVPTGDCEGSAERISFSWTEDGPMKLSLDLYFNKTSSDYSLTYVHFDYSTGVALGSSNASWGASAEDAKVKTKLNTYYNCTIGVTTTVGGMTLNLTDFLVSAFVQESGDHPVFSKPGTNCTYQGPTDAIVPIAVGAALAAMVLIVLIGYCIGRRRAANNAYQSMNNA